MRASPISRKLHSHSRSQRGPDHLSCSSPRVRSHSVKQLFGLRGLVMISAFARLLALTCLVGVFGPQAVWAQSNDLAALNKKVVKLYQSGKYAKAAALAKRALALAERGFGPNHRKVSTTLDNLALLYLEQGRYAAAEPLFRRSLRIREKALGR